MTSTTPSSLLVVGSGLAGLSAVRAARALGFAGPVTVLGREPHRPYDRPPLSKEYLAGAVGRADLRLEGAHEDLGVDWRLGTAAALHPGEGVTTTDGDWVAADAVLLAAGAAARTLPELPAVENVLTLRTVEDADRLRAELGPGRRVVVVGGGLISCEVAATAYGLGCSVTLLTRDSVPLALLYGSALAPHLAARHARHGVDFRADVKVSGAQLTGGRVTALTLADGEELPADVVLVAVGTEPEIGWLSTSGLDLGDGVPCDASGRALAGGRPVPGVAAVGDCAAWWDPHLQRHHRAQHWTDALERPTVAVAALLGVEPPRRRPYLPYFWSDQYGEQIQMAGYASLADDVEVTDGDPATGPFVAVYRRTGEPVAVLALSRPREFTRWRKTLVGSLGHVPELPTTPSPVAAPAAAAPHPAEQEVLL